MPLLRRSTFSLLEPPDNLDPNEEVFQIRFTKEIFRDYQEYLNRLNLYRQKVWTCEVSGKSNLTYEEALVCEQQAAVKAQLLPKELIAHVLEMIQYSTLSLTDLLEKVYCSLLLDFFEGQELHAKKDGSEAACKILKVIGSGSTKLYEVGWLGQENAVVNTSVVKADDLIRKKAPASRNILKMFIRDSTSKRSPWIVNADLARKYGIDTEPPEDIMNGEDLYKGRKRFANGEDTSNKLKKDEKLVGLPVKYPIDDLLVKPTADDPILPKRPPLSRDFRVPVDSVGDLLMVWEFCLSFGRLLCLSPFSLSDLENAICNKESNLVLVVEMHAALFHLLIRDEGEYFTFLLNKKKTLKVTLVTWAEYLCNFLEMIRKEEFSSKVSKIRRGHYGLLDTGLKLKILRELVEEAITTSAVRGQLNEWIDQQQALAAAKREDARKNREEQKFNMEGVAENGINHTDTIQNDNECPKNQPEGKEQKGLNIFLSSKTGDEKMFLRRHLETEMEQQSLRPGHLGKDRFYNRYWFFRCEGRLFAESADSKEWGYYSTKEELDALLGSLNIKGTRERALKRQLDKSYDKISNALENTSKDTEQKTLHEEVDLRRSTRIHAQPKEDSPSMSFLKYINKWKQK
ncbi:hypothetical protein SEVIR_7G113400v4 [Setaria viridis]|uniref:DDT domain-containing protein n=1 Tax=Setaria viridis TaxID=4556 RepID=A0A4U6TNY3_SETVI|nr:DDT domain-containing protein DDB_G0282237-like [Setaria viridis]TKW04497.1 hypothetical protein SEVIR_7G113400v2 [Setaria viridis]TKW04498.1 hypothetical protein SEVIR_7G113400v2 [Setaria viridis]